jgi:hypothetical protein
VGTDCGRISLRVNPDDNRTVRRDGHPMARSYWPQTAKRLLHAVELAAVGLAMALVALLVSVLLAPGAAAAPLQCPGVDAVFDTGSGGASGPSTPYRPGSAR